MLSDKQQAYRELLVLRCKRHDPAALDELVREWERRLFYYICRLIDDEQDEEAELPSFAAEDALRVHEALAQLTVHHREVLTLCFLEEMSIEEVAAVVNVPAGTVKSRLYHAKRTMRALLREDENERVG